MFLCYLPCYCRLFLLCFSSWWYSLSPDSQLSEIDDCWNDNKVSVLNTVHQHLFYCLHYLPRAKHNNHCLQITVNTVPKTNVYCQIISKCTAMTCLSSVTFAGLDSGIETSLDVTKTILKSVIAALNLRSSNIKVWGSWRCNSCSAWRALGTAKTVTRVP